MFCKLSLLALVAPLVSALTIQAPKNPTSGGSITIIWGSAPTDPDTWTFELTNPSFHDAIAIANNVNPTAGQLTLVLPIIPAEDDYTIEAVNIGNITDIFATSPSFSVGVATVSVTSSSSTSSGTKSTSSGSTTSAVVTTSASSTAGITSNIVTSSDTSIPTTSTTSDTSPATNTPFNGALSSRLSIGSPVGGMGAILLSVVAGAAMFAF